MRYHPSTFLCVYILLEPTVVVFIINNPRFVVFIEILMSVKFRSVNFAVDLEAVALFNFANIGFNHICLLSELNQLMLLMSKPTFNKQSRFVNADFIAAALDSVQKRL
jgi:hypothetical protein